MSLSCMKSALLLQGRAAGLSRAEGLLLEEHLGTCERCSADAQTLAAIVEVLGSAPAPLRAAVRERAIARALAGPMGTDAAPSPLADRRRLAIAAFAAVAAVIALLFGSPWKAGGPDVAVVSPVDPSPHLLQGRCEIDGAPVAAGATWAAGTALRALEPVKVRVAHAVVDLDAETVVRWDASRATLAITAGRARLDVDPTPGEPFRVTAGDILVEVLGTHFEVTSDRVTVSHGRVRVTDHGSGAVTELSAGETWVARITPPASAAAPPSGASSVTAPAAAASSTAAPSAVAPTTEAGARPPPSASAASAPHAAPVLARARRLLAAGKAAEAARLVHSALGMRPTPSEEAEARTLLAECALASGDEAEAARRYAEVADRHRDLPAGETALFAAARAEERAGRREAAVALLRRYLATYPQGRFRQEAQARLQSAIAPRSPR